MPPEDSLLPVYQVAEHPRRELDALLDIAPAISTLDVERCLQAVASQAQSLLQAASGRVFLIDTAGLCLRAASGVGAEQAGHLILPGEQGLCGWAAAHREIALASNTQTDPRYVPTLSSIRSEAAIPLIYETDVIGILDVQSEHEQAFGAGDIDVLKRLAALAAIAIHNAQLFQAERAQRTLAEALRDTAAALHNSLNLEEVLDRILDNVGLVVSNDAANVMLIDGAIARVVRARGYAERGLHEWVMSLVVSAEDLFSLKQLTNTSQPLLVADTRAEPQWYELPQTGWIRSYLGAPLRVQGQIVGILNLDSATPDFFTVAHGARLKAFAQQAASAIENAQLVSELHRQVDRERLINQITNRIRSSLDLDQIIQTTVQELGHVIHASRCLIRLGADADYMPIMHELDQPGIPALSSLGLLTGTREKLLAHQTLVLDDTRHRSPPLYRTGIRALLATPILVRNSLLGALIFHECRRPRRWLTDEIELVETIAGQVGIAIENARLYHETRQQLGELAILHSAAIATADSTTLDEALHKAVRAVYDALGEVDVTILLIKPDADDLIIRASLGYAAADLARLQIKIGQGVTGWVAQTGQPALVSDVTADPRYLCHDPRIRSELCVPLRTGARVVGVLNVESRQLDAFTERDLQLLTTLSHHLTIIIENIRLLEEVQAANDRLTELDRLKSQFLANMSHELRTPLNAIIGFSELISDGRAGPVSPEQLDYLHNVHTGGRHLLALINDILDLSKIQAGRMTLERQSVAVASIVAEAQAIVAPLTARKQQQFNVQLPAALPAIEVDPLRIKQVLINLLSNACKFTPAGGAVTLRVSLIDADLLLISVSDTGRGIPLVAQATLFEEFQQVGDAADREAGTGLGLAIAQRLIELHGGKIWVESAGQPGLGSTFYFTVPVHASGRAPFPTDRAAPLHALIVEDDHDFSELIALHLRQIGYRTQQCYTGAAARTALQDRPPDLITLDMQLPDTDGWTLLHEIKNTPQLHKVGVLVISGLELAHVAATAGIEYLAKPILKHSLALAIERLRNRQADRPLRILLVDDDPLLIELLVAILPPPDYDVVTALNGTYAVEQIQQQLPDLVILDLLMPDMNGFELLTVLRRDPRTRDLPVLVLTAKTLNPDEQAELAQAAQGVLPKTSLRRDRLLAEIYRLRPALPPP
jgi:GAF domain-containing protein/DNA-binding response OmpR family regulator